MDSLFGIGEYGALTALVLVTGFIVWLITGVVKTWIAAWADNQKTVRENEKARLDAEEKQTSVLEKMNAAMGLMVTQLEQSSVERSILSNIMQKTYADLSSTQTLVSSLQEEKKEHIQRTETQHTEVIASIKRLEDSMNKVISCVENGNSASKELRQELNKLSMLIDKVSTEIRGIIHGESG